MTLTLLGRLYAADANSRTLKGMLLPFGVPGYTSAGKLLCSAGTVTIPEDVTSMEPANLGHDGEHPAATWQAITETTEGLEAEWHVPDTPNGDRLLAEFRAGMRTGVSIELEPGYVARGGSLVSGKLATAAFVTKPAFDTARLAASYVPDTGERLTADFDTESSTESVDTYQDEDGNTVTVTTTRKVTESSVTETGTEDDTEDDGEPADADTTEEPANVTDALKASKTRNTKAAPGVPATLAEFIRKVAAGNRNRDSRLLASLNGAIGPDQERLLAALNDVTNTAHEGTINAPQWLGELWSGVAYERRIVPLLTSGTLSSYTLKGWRWVTKPVMAAYAGDKALVPSNTPQTEPVEIEAERLAGAHDIDRKFRDFGDESFFAAYYAAMSESYARLTDAAALADVLAQAPPVVAGAVPSGVSEGMALIVDGALAVVNEGRPTFAIVANDVYRDILLTPADKRLEQLTSALGLDGGNAVGLRIEPFPTMAPGTALVGVKAAATFYELPGVPIRAEAVDMVKGGIDAGVFGYYATNVHDTDGLALVSATV